MGTATYSVGRYAPSRGQAPAVLSSEIIASGTQATTTTATDISGLTVTRGTILRIHADEAMLVAVASGDASPTNGHYIPAGTIIELEVRQTGAVSLEDVA